MLKTKLLAMEQKCAKQYSDSTKYCLTLTINSFNILAEVIIYQFYYLLLYNICSGVEFTIIQCLCCSVQILIVCTSIDYDRDNFELL